MRSRLPRITKAFILSEPLNRICETIARRPPETGGILLGPPDRDVVTTFIFDTEGSQRATGAWYTPHIPSLQGQVDELHEKHGYVIKGFIHSHPGSMRELSSGDLCTIARYFDDAQPLPYFFAPIVWAQYQRPFSSTESDDLELTRERRMSWHVIHPEDENPSPRETVPIHEIFDMREAPLSGRPLVVRTAASGAAVTPAKAPTIHLEKLKHRLRATSIRDLRLDYAGCNLYAIEIRIDQTEIALLFPTEFPLFPPHIMFTACAEGSPFRLSFESTAWKISRTVSVEEKLTELIEGALKKKLHVVGSGERQAYKYGPADGAVVCTSDPETAREQGWIRNQALRYEFHDLQEQYFARSGGILSRGLTECSVLLAGCGSGGSYIAEQLVRSGVGHLILCDPDRVSLHNLCRSGYRVADIDLPKVKALARHLRNINPQVRVDGFATTIEALEEAGELRALIAGADLVIAGTDSPRAQKILGRYSYRMGAPALFPGLYERAQGGEILLTWPARRTPCYHCMLGFRGQERESLRGNLDYSTGTLVAEPGLSVDIHHLDSITTKLALGLLLQGVPSEQRCEVRDFVCALSDGTTHRTYVLSGHSPGFWIFGQLYGDTNGAHQAYAYQTLWLDITNRRRSDCETCGDHPIALSTPGRLDIEALLDDSSAVRLTQEALDEQSVRESSLDESR